MNDLQPGLVKVLNSESNGDTTRYLHDISGLHSQQTPGGDWVFPIMDALGSLRGVVNPTGEVLEGQGYAPYGSPFGHTGTAQMPFGFTGEITDASGLVYLRARYYVPELGVFPSLDPVEEGNRYGYVGGDVVNRVDPSGEIPTLDEIKSERSRYSCRCGWLDKAHVSGGFKLAQDIERVLSASIDYAALNALEGYRAFVPQERGLSLEIPFNMNFGVHIPDGIIPTSKKERLETIGLGIYMMYEEGFESFQAGFNWLVNVLGRPSGFAEEDLPSDLIGYWVGLTDYHQPSSYFRRIGDGGSSLCEILGLDTGQDLEASEYMYREYTKHGLAGAFSTNWRFWERRPRPSGNSLWGYGCSSEMWPRELASLVNQAVRKSGQWNQTELFTIGAKNIPQNGWYELVGMNRWMYKPVPNEPGLFVIDRQWAEMQTC